jgi:hypothetical protein
MRCPRCKSLRVQRGYNNAPLPLRMLGLHELLCNRCGLEFKGFDPFARFAREPSVETESPGDRRRAPRYTVHVPTTISLVEGEARAGTVSYTQPSRGHCEAISEHGMTLSFVGTRFTREELSRKGRLLFVRVNLPNGPVDAVVSIVMLNRIENVSAIAKWIAGVKIYQMTEEDMARLRYYLDRCAETLVSE